MDTVLILAGGRRVHALLLSASQDCLRVVIPGYGDTEEFRRVDGGWISGRGLRMEIGALMVTDGVMERFLPKTQVRALTA